MPNEEPEGPNLPPRPKKVQAKIEQDECSVMEIKSDKYVELKGIIGALAASFIIISYLIYYYYYYYHDTKLNELYFISSGIGISVFTGLLFTFFKNVCIKTILLFTSIFYAMLEVIYIAVWLIQGQPYAHIKIALIVGLIIGILYIAYDKFTNKPRDVNQ